MAQGPAVLYGKFQHFGKFPVVFWRHYCHIRHHRQIRKIKASLMGSFRLLLPALRSVHCKNHMKILHTYVVEDLIYRPLKEGRINSHYRNYSAKGQTCSKGNRMLFCNSHVKKPVGKLLSNFLSPVPSGMAAVIPTSFLCSFPKAVIVSEKTSV